MTKDELRAIWRAWRYDNGVNFDAADPMWPVKIDGWVFNVEPHRLNLGWVKCGDVAVETPSGLMYGEEGLVVP